MLSRAARAFVLAFVAAALTSISAPAEPGVAPRKPHGALEELQQNFSLYSKSEVLNRLEALSSDPLEEAALSSELREKEARAAELSRRWLFAGLALAIYLLTLGALSSRLRFRELRTPTEALFVLPIYLLFAIGAVAAARGGDASVAS